MPRMRTVKQVVKYFKEKDPDTALTEWFIRGLPKGGKFKGYIMAGGKYLYDLDALEEFLKNPPVKEPIPMQATYGALRKVGV